MNRWRWARWKSHLPFAKWESHLSQHHSFNQTHLLISLHYGMTWYHMFNNVKFKWGESNITWIYFKIFTVFNNITLRWTYAAELDETAINFHQRGSNPPTVVSLSEVLISINTWHSTPHTLIAFLFQVTFAIKAWHFLLIQAFSRPSHGRTTAEIAFVCNSSLFAQRKIPKGLQSVMDEHS